MEPQGRFIEKRTLGNGLTIHFYDESRPIVGNRSQVQLLILVPIEVEAHYFHEKPDPGKAYELFTAAFGKVIHFKLEKVRNFIDEAEVPSVLDKLKEEFLQAGMAYISKQDFAQKYVLRKYESWEKVEAERKAYLKVARDRETEK